MNHIERIAATLANYDPQAMSIDSVTDFLAQLVQPVGQIQQVSLSQALGRVLAADIISPINVPANHNSAMDGYAFDGAQLKPGQSLQLEVIAQVLAGAVWHQSISAGQCVQIMTGAVLPAGLNTVVPQELVERSGKHIHIKAGSVKPGEHCRWQGEDLKQGQPALLKGTLLTPAALGLLASLGLSSAPVWRQLKVAYFSTGNEILSPGQAPQMGSVFDSNRYSLFGLLTQLGCSVIDLAGVPDQAEALQAAFEQAASQADVIITSGGVGQGAADHIQRVVQNLGQALRWRISMRPGQTLLLGQIKSSKQTDDLLNPAIVFGLPGNPVAAMVSFLLLLRPTLLRMMGRQVKTPLLLPARSTQALSKKPGRTEYLRGIVSCALDGTLQVQTTGNQGSGVLSSMVQANALIVLPAAVSSVDIGQTVQVMLLDAQLN